MYIPTRTVYTRYYNGLDKAEADVGLFGHEAGLHNPR